MMFLENRTATTLKLKRTINKNKKEINKPRIFFSQADMAVQMAILGGLKSIFYFNRQPHQYFPSITEWYGLF